MPPTAAYSSSPRCCGDGASTDSGPTATTWSAGRSCWPAWASSTSHRGEDMTQDPVAVIGGLFASEGLADYLGEPVTQAAHMLQAAALAQQAGAPPALVAAALLHDVGHFT